MCIVAAVKQSEIFKGLLLQRNEYAGKQLLIRNGIFFEPVGHHIVDVFDEYHVAVYLVQVLYQGTVAARSEE